MSHNPTLKDKIFSNPAGYSIFYICLSVPTYIIPWIKPGAVSKAAEAAGYVKGQSSLAMVYTVIQLALFAGLVWGAHVRGQKTNKTYLKYFAIAAGCFDLLPLLTYIPFVPSVMHALGIGMGLSDEKKVNNENHVNTPPQNQHVPQPETFKKSA